MMKLDRLIRALASPANRKLGEPGRQTSEEFATSLQALTAKENGSFDELNEDLLTSRTDSIDRCIHLLSESYNRLQYTNDERLVSSVITLASESISRTLQALNQCARLEETLSNCRENWHSARQSLRSERVSGYKPDLAEFAAEMYKIRGEWNRFYWDARAELDDCIRLLSSSDK